MECKLRSLFLWFMMYAVFGWCYEVFLEVVVYQWGYSDRGILFGPYCPVYGVGALLFLLCFGRLAAHPTTGWNRLGKLLLLFLGCMAVATALELAASYALEWLTGSWPWQTYRDYKWNFQGRIALSPSVRFGLGGLIFLYLFQPLFRKATNILSDRGLKLLSNIIGLIFLLDCLATAVVLLLTTLDLSVAQALQIL